MVTTPDSTPWAELVAALVGALAELAAVEVSVSINGTPWSGLLSELTAALETAPIDVVVTVSSAPRPGYVAAVIPR